ncbi:histone H4 transcription factor [Battus philenor]|uniref:histone H4 transcription factor n=1 Tax=Battus philenor TaxID=42288 RepID=UPI0035D02D14
MDNPKVNLKLLRCADWLQKQNEQEPKKLSLQNKNDIQFIIQTNADRKNFLLAAAEDEATVPAGVDETETDPKPVPLRRLRIEELCLECEWHSCKWKFEDYEVFQKHVTKHISDLHVIEKQEENKEYVCLWDVCGHKTTNFEEMVRHINYHSYHAKLMAIGYNGRATLNLERCKRESSKRNQLPPYISEHNCLWVGCKKKFNSMQTFIDHVRIDHVEFSKGLCSWAGCGAVFPRRALLRAHIRTHTGERLIACYHCGQHFANNRKLCDHLRRQNVNPQQCYHCSICGVNSATEYLSREHSRQHVSVYVCALCDMSAPSVAALAQHVRYRHLGRDAARLFPCPHCTYRAVTKCDLRKHIPTHTKKKKRKAKEEMASDGDLSDGDTDDGVRKKPREARKYACHMCPEKETKVFSRGSRLTTHLVKVHGAQWPFGYSRFRYQISKDGIYRLTTTRIEEIEISKKIVDGYSDPKESLTNSYEFDLQQVAGPTEISPAHIMIQLKGVDGKEIQQEEKEKDSAVEITMCDVDEVGNIINSEVINSDVLYT